MTTTLQIKRSVTSGHTPTSLANGELGVNPTDARLFVGNGSAAYDAVQNVQNNFYVNGVLTSTISLLVGANIVINTTSIFVNTSAGNTMQNATGFYINGVAVSGGGGTPGGSNTDVQFNNSGAFAGSGGLFTYNYSTNTIIMNVANVSHSGGNVIFTSNIYFNSANEWFGGGKFTSVSNVNLTCANIFLNATNTAFVGTNTNITTNNSISGTNTTISANVFFTGNVVQFPSGNTVQRSSSPANAYLRYNTDINTLEAFINGFWNPVTIMPTDTIIGTNPVTQGNSTNILAFSQDLTQAAWTATTITVSANVGNAPDGTNSALKLLPTSATATLNVSQSNTLASNSNTLFYTASIYVSNVVNSTYTANTLLSLSFSNSTPSIVTTGTINFNPGTGLITNPTGVTNYGSYMTANGWWRLWLVLENTGTAAANNITANFSFEPDVTANQNLAVVWGAQLEQNTLPSSYIFTGSAARSTIAGLSTIGLNIGNAYINSTVLSISANNQGFLSNASGIYAGDISLANMACYMNGTAMHFGNSSGDVWHINAAGFYHTGSNTVIISQTWAAGAGQPGNAIFANGSFLEVGNTTVNAILNSSALRISNSTANTIYTPIGIQWAVKVTVNAASGTGTYTPTTNLVYVEVECVGAGGGSGACQNGSTAFVASGGGGGGAYSKKTFTYAQINGIAVSYTVGTAGAAGTNGTTGIATNGTATVFPNTTNQNFNTLAANGGTGGLAANSTVFGAGGGAGGVAWGNADISVAGTAGGAGIRFTAETAVANNGCMSGDGGDAGMWGRRGKYVTLSGSAATTSNAGQAGQQYGGGASGSCAGNTVTSAIAGAAGANGYIVITEYYHT